MCNIFKQQKELKMLDSFVKIKTHPNVCSLLLFTVYTKQRMGQSIYVHYFIESRKDESGLVYFSSFAFAFEADKADAPQ